MARAYRLAAERGRRGAAYNVATGRPVSIGEIARRLAALSRIPLRIRGDRGRADVITGDSTALREDTGWVPEIPLGRTLSDLLDHERAALEPNARARA